MLAAGEELCDESGRCVFFVQMGVKDFRANRGKSLYASYSQDQKQM